jgi:hypothetical protein
MKYFIFFIVTGIAVIYNSILHELYFLAILTIPCSLLAMAYLFNKPSLVMGKKSNGKSSVFLSLINSPWLIITYICWFITKIMSQEDERNRIINNIFISRYPTNLKENEFDIIIDLTCEFPKPKTSNNNYVSMSNLDGIELSNIKFPEIKSDSRILIHCAQGHGRSSTYCSLLLIDIGLAKNVDEALEIIQNARPKAIPSRKQLEQLRTINQT